MTKIVCSTSKHSVGCTFLDWSINYLKGETKFFNRNLGWLDLTNNPINSRNAHGHRKNHPDGFDKTCEYVNFLQKNSDFASLYPSPMLLFNAATKLNQSMLNLDNDAWEKLIKFQDQDYNQMLHWLDKQGAKIVFVSANKSLPLYINCQIRSTERVLHSNREPASDDEVRQSRDIVFFQRSVKQWEELELKNIWDTRERLALDTRPFQFREENVDLSINHFWIDCYELWFNGDKKVPEILDWLEIKIDTNRLSQWLLVYHKWRDLQSKTLSFQHTHQHIVDSIINGWSYPIDLTFDQEVVIQHCLIYQHNLNLKTWQLTKFPSNTKDLHALLEPNIHPVENIYQHTK